MLLTVNATSGAAWCCWWFCSLVDGKLQKSFIRNNRVKKISSEPDAVIKRATCGSRATGSRPLGYIKRSIQKALQLWRMVNSLKLWKTSKGVFHYPSARPRGIWPVCPMVNPALLHVCVIRSRTTEPNIDIGESAKQAFSSGNTGPQRRVARTVDDEKTDAIFCDLFYEVFPKQKWKCFRNKNTIFLKRKCFYLENICETKVFSNESKTVFIFEMKRFWFANNSESVSETKIKFF